MNNDQVSMVESVHNDVVPSQKKNKLWLVAVIIIAVVVIIVGVVVALSLNQKREENTPAEGVADKNSDVLQIFTELEDKIAIDDIYEVVRNKNAGATVELDDGFGIIKMQDDNEKDYIMFYFEHESEGTDADTDIEANMAYGFTYVAPYEDDIGQSIYCTDVCEYFNGTEEHEYKTKEEAVRAFLADSN